MATATTRLRIGPADHGRRMTIQEFLDAEEEEGYRYELARGILEVSQVPNEPHGVVVSNLFDTVSRYRRDHPRYIYRYGGGSEFQFVIPEFVSGRNPDLGVALLATPKDDRGRRRPALGAEVVSRSSVQRDYVVKREEYHVYGLDEYWIVDPWERQVTVLTRREDGWDEQVVRGNQVIPSRVLPGLLTTVNELWQGLEEVGDAPEEDANGDAEEHAP